jgi:nicotinate dehydrogenase subunit B
MIHFRDDGSVEVFAGKVELGQGILTALRQIAADELGMALDRVRITPACTEHSANQGVTSGSLSVENAGKALRDACAAARIERGLHRIEGAAASVGTSAARIDLPDKVMGRARFIHDVEPRGLLHGRVLRPPSPQARLRSLDEARAQSIPGVIAVVREGRFVGVVAQREEAAVAAIERLRRDAHWSESPTLPDATVLPNWLRAQKVETSVVGERATPTAAVAARTLRGAFSRPFIAHASIGPVAAIARWREGKLRVWSQTQGIFNLRSDLAVVFGMKEEDIVVQHEEGAGCYGHNGADDVALDAALLARAAGEHAVKVVWSREDELAWAPFGPAMAVDLESDLDGAGEVLAWRGDVWSNGHGTRPGRGTTPTLLAATHLDRGWEMPVAVNQPIAGGGGAERNSLPEYEMPAVRVRSHRLLAMPLRVSALRGLGAFANVFAIESLVDDIAAARGEDPLAWRLRHLKDPRSCEVLQAAARRFRWDERERGEGRGFGVGYARYKGNGAWCAVMAEIEVEAAIRVKRLVIAADVGLAVNPDGVANQLEGGAIQATSWALKEAVAFDDTRVTSASWEAYPILRFSEVPRVEVELLQRREEPSKGAGEASLGPTAAAIGNALFDALGVRVRDLPLTPERIVAAMA